MPTLGPGTLTIGETGSEIDASCLLNNARIAMSKDVGDPTTKLCGTQRPGKITYTYALSGNVDTDIADASGLFALSQTAAGQELPFKFVPSSEAGTSAEGVLVMDPLDFGADEYGDDLTSDFEFDLVGKPSYTYPEASGDQAEAAKARFDKLLASVSESAKASSFRRLVVNGAPGNPTAAKPASAPEPAKAKA